MKERIDVLLVQQGFYETREKAKRALMAGLVTVNGQPIDKPGTTVDDQVEISVKGAAIPFVSRGGLKLDKALKTFNIGLDHLSCLDIGASTGGFTDCMLQNGASRVYAIDVGYGQLDWKLRSDSRVVNLERTNVRYVTQDQVPDLQDFFSVDVAFISLKLVLPAVLPLLKESAQGVVLIKPQFEAGREQVGKKGVVRDPNVHKQVVLDILNMTRTLGLKAYHLDYSPITGPNGNIEFLLHLGFNHTDMTLDESQFEEAAQQIVNKAHQVLK